MAKTVDTLLIEIKAETRNLKKGLGDVNKKLDQTKQKSKDVGGSLKALGGVLVGLGAGAALAGTVNTIRTFEDLEATLRAVTGSAEAASKSFELIRKFTATTTFQVDEVAQAFITLKQAGVVPTSDALQDFGNFAAGMGKSITDLAQAAFNATTGEMEMLKQFGVIARQQGDKITVTFDGTTQVIERTGASVIDFLRSIGRERFPDAIEQRANTLSGAISNLQDAFSEFQVQIGDGGLRQTLADIAIDFKELLQENRKLAETVGKVLSVAFQALANVLIFVLKNLKFLAVFLAGSFVQNMVTAKVATGGLTISMKGLTAAVATARASLVRLGRVARRNAVGILLTVGAIGADALGLFGDAADDAGDDVDELDKELNKLMNGVQDVTTLLNSSQKTTFGFFQEMQTQAQQSGGAIRDLAKNDFAELEATLRRVQKLELAKSLFALPREIKSTIPELADKSFSEIFQVLENPTFLGKSKGFQDAFTNIIGSVNDELLMGFNSIPELIDFLETKPFESLLNEQEASFLDFSRSLIDETELLKDAFNNMTDEGLMDMFNTIKQFLPETLQDFETFKQEVGDALNDAGDDAFVFSDALEDALTAASLQISANFVQALRSGEDAMESFKNLALSIVDQVVAAFIQMQIIDPIIDAIFSGFDGTPETSTPKTSSTGGKAVGQAGGGAMHSRMPRLVGERGPELFVPHSAGTLLNNMNTRNALGGGQTVVVNQSVNFATGVQATVRNEVLQLMPQIADATKSAVSESAERNLRFRGALQGA